MYGYGGYGGYGRLAGSWELLKASARVLRSDKELLIFPFVSALATLAVTITFIVPMILAGLIDRIATGQSNVQIVGAVVAFVYYLIQYFIIFFTNTALVGAALIRLDGGNPTVGDGFRIAAARAGSILGYALIAATVGMVLRWIAERFGLVGQIVSGLLGATWNIATFLVVPVLVVENVGPVDAVKRSTSLLKRTWGEQIIGNLGIGLAFGLLTLAVMLLFVPAFMLAVQAQSLAAIVGVAAALIIVVLFLSLISAALSGIYRAAVYRYAATGQVAPGFNPQLIQAAFRERRRSRVLF